MDETTTGGEGGEFDPKEAAKLLETTTRRAQRQFEFPSPLLALNQSGPLLAAYCSDCLSVRGPPPFMRPCRAPLVHSYAFLALAAVPVGVLRPRRLTVVS